MRNRLPPALPSTDILSLVARVGAATPELVAALLVGCPLSDLSTGDICRMDQRVVPLMRRGLLSRDIARSSLRALRTAERMIFKITPEGLERLDSVCEDTVDGAILGAVRDRALTGTGGWACLLDLWDEAMPHWSNRRNVVHRVRRLVTEGLLEEMCTRPRHQLAVLSITDSGLAAIRDAERRSRRPATNPTRPPRLDQSVHHLLVLLAAAKLAAARGLTVDRVRGDEELRSHTRRGMQTTAGSTLPALPDGRVTLVDHDGAHREVDIEVIVSGYTDVQIVDKYRRLDPETIYVVVSRNLADRVERLGLPRPILVW